MPILKPEQTSSDDYRQTDTEELRFSLTRVTSKHCGSFAIGPKRDTWFLEMSVRDIVIAAIATTGGLIAAAQHLQIPLRTRLIPS